MKHLALIFAGMLLLMLVFPVGANAEWGDTKPADSIDLEFGLYRFTRNDVRIPNEGGTRFALDDLTGASGSDLRLHATWWWNERNALRLTLVMDFEGAWSPQGRAFDIGLRVERDFAGGWYGHAGLRTLEGGADVSDVYAW